MSQTIESILTSPIPKLLILFVAPTTFIGMVVFPNATVYYIEKNFNYLNQSNLTVDYLSDENEEPCQNCHTDIATEIQNTPHHRNFDCTVCHEGKGDKNVSCLDCHEVVGFAAHARLMEWAENSDLMYSSNEACIACHTNAEIPIYEIEKKSSIDLSMDIRNFHL